MSDTHSRAGEPLRLRKLARHEVALSEAVGSVRWAAIEVDGAPVDVMLEPSAGLPQDELSHGPLTLQTAHGRLDLMPGAPVLRLLTGIDLPEPDVNDAAMRWLLVDTAAAHMPAAWRELFSMQSVEYGVAAPAGATLGLRLHPRGAGWSLSARLSGEPDVLRALVTSGAWHGGAGGGGIAESRLAVRQSVVVGEATLSHVELRSLVVGDAIVVERLRFDFDGRGGIAFGDLRMDGRLRAADGVLSFEFECWSECMNMQEGMQDDASLPENGHAGEEGLPDGQPDAVDEPSAGGATVPPDDAGAQADAAAQAPAQAAQLDKLPILLSFEVGAIDMPLAALRRLAPGSVIELQRPLPPQVVVRCRGIEVARGELVDLGGGLAVQITQLES